MNQIFINNYQRDKLVISSSEKLTKLRKITSLNKIRVIWTEDTREKQNVVERLVEISTNSPMISMKQSVVAKLREKARFLLSATQYTTILFINPSFSDT